MICVFLFKSTASYKTKISKIVILITSSAVNKRGQLRKGIGCLKKLQLLLSLYLNDETGYSTLLKPVAYLKCFWNVCISNKDMIKVNNYDYESSIATWPWQYMCAQLL